MGEEHNLNDIFDAAMEDAFWGDLPQTEYEDDELLDPSVFDLDSLMEDETVDLFEVGTAYGIAATD